MLAVGAKFLANGRLRPLAGLAIFGVLTRTTIRSQCVTACGLGLTTFPARSFGFVLATVRQPALIVFQVAFVFRNPTLVHQPEVINRVTQQVTIMGNHHNRPLKVLQRHGQGLTHFQVQMVGGLVQQQQVGLLPGNHRQRHTGLFTTGE